MSTRAQEILEQLKKLPDAEQQEVLRELLRAVPKGTKSVLNDFPSVRVSGGAITSEQVAEALDDK
jgi:hypothetical protein